MKKGKEASFLSTAGVFYSHSSHRFIRPPSISISRFEKAVKKPRNWLNIAEYCLLAGSGVGSLATLASQQILYTAAPMSALFLLNLVNRRRIAESLQETAATSVSQLDYKFSGDIGSLQKQVQAFPSFLDLASLRKSVQRSNQEALAGLSQEIALLKQEAARPEWQLVNQAIRQLQEQYAVLADSVAGVTGQLQRLSAPSPMEGVEEPIAQLKAELSQLRVKLEGLDGEQKVNNHRALQDQINHLNRRLNQMPPPFDASSLKQDISSLVKAMGDMASRREMARLVAQLEQLSQQNKALEQSVTPVKVATTILKKQLDTITTRLNASEQEGETPQLTLPPSTPLSTQLAEPDSQVIHDLKATVRALEQRLSQLETASHPNLQAEVQGMASTHLQQLQQQLTAVQQFTQNLERKQTQLRDWVSRLPQLLDASALQSQMQDMSARLDWAETLGLDMQAQVEATVQQRLDEAIQQLQALRPGSEYELVFDLKGGRSQPRHALSGCCSRAMLEQALEKAQARLILVYPYPTPQTLNPEVIHQFKAFLDRKGCLDIGWGHLGNISTGRLSRPINRRRAIDPIEKGYLYDTLNQLTQLKKQYPDQFRFKVLGTDENFLVCDRTFAVLGTQSMPIASAIFPQTAVGLRTTDSEVIQELLDRFDEPVLDSEDALAYFKRAITRYDLGDRQGAVEDYSEVLRIDPDDDVAYNNRALALYDLGDRQGAIDDFGLAVQHNPENFIAYTNRGFVRSELGDKLGAIEDYTDAIQLNPDYATAYFYRGLARTRVSNKLGAIQDYSQVIRLDPKNAIAHFYRGLACIKLGQRADAIRDLRQAAQLFSEQGDMANYQQTLKMLEKLHTTLTVTSSSQPLVPNGV